ncbi:OLC1v1009583C1 [Oldenlandia corymbosa var. corymbosa]|uniref:OLC1v1009583C1 n=1 Tax=Oldenlandia corymbosa var. corymbosa TaxID=529605 RepID=A0AAV1DPA6_OLDCO|nr:OLC1v1009583C1 [Oldenlandia corymbosa var. corymbosa]
MLRNFNNLIRSYANSSGNLQKEALRIFVEMRRSGALPNEHTYPFVFKACSSIANLTDGRQVHSDVVKHGLASNVYVQNTLIHFYGCCKNVIDAYKVFDEMSFRTVVSWNSILSAFIESSWFDESVDVFFKMRRSGIQPGETTMVILLSACSEIGNLSLGKWIHSQVIVRGLVMNCQLGTALVDMYGKSGNVGNARLVFDRMSERNVWTWSAMILGLAQHGFANQALELFQMMDMCSIRPNYVTFLGVLTACSHAGLVDDGRRFFNEMEHIHKIKPKIVHYGAMVDILSRAGRLQEGYDFILKMPVKDDPITWRTLLSACNIHDVNDSTGIGEKVRQRLLELEPRRGENLVMVANKYAEIGMWEESERLRKKMRDRGLKKVRGESWIDVDGSVFRFLSGTDFQVPSEDIYVLAERLNLHTKMVHSVHCDYD